MYSTSYGLSLYRNLSCHFNKTMDIRAICSQAWKFLLNTKFDFYNRAKHCIHFSKSYLSPQYVHLQNTLLKRSRPQCIINTKIKKRLKSCAPQHLSSWSEYSISLNRLFFSMFSFTFCRFSCFLCMESFFIFSSSLSSPLYAISSFSRKISRARFLFKSTDLVWWHCKRTWDPFIKVVWNW